MLIYFVVNKNKKFIDLTLSYYIIKLIKCINECSKCFNKFVNVNTLACSLKLYLFF